MDAVAAQKISFTYHTDDYAQPALRDITLTVRQGEFVAILGPNGSGKSTLAKHLNGILQAQQGNLSVLHIDPKNAKTIWQLRRLCGMVFQNPDNQFVSPIVEQDVAFGLQNHGVAPEEIPQRVEKALAMVDMSGSQRRSPAGLSGGQKQRVALAGVLAVEPELIVLDEATSMLDPEGRQEVLTCLQTIHKMGKTVLMITHCVEEALQAQRILLMHEGGILADGTPREILTDARLLKRAKLLPPVAVQLYWDLREKGICLASCPLTEDEFVEEVCRLK